MITNLQPKEDTPAGTRQQQLQGSELEGNRPRGLIHMNKETVIRHLANKKDKNSICLTLMTQSTNVASH